MNEIKGFTFFKNYYDVISELSTEDKREMLEAIVDYIFKDKVPEFTGLKKGIWQLIERPLDISKRNGSNKSKTNGKQMKKKSKQNGKQMETKCSDLSISISNSISNSNNNILENRGYGGKKPFKEIIDYLNLKTNSKYKSNTKSTQEKINARLNEGFTTDDFIVVIDKKCKEWLGTEFEMYLRPETLFGTKFESYLNQSEKINRKEENVPKWFNKEIEEEKATLEEQEEMRKILGGI